MKIDRYRTERVDFIPEQLENGVFYVTFEFATGVHLCPCGCGREVATPFSLLDWRLVFDGTFSVRPSIGSMPCGSHYFLSHGEFVAAPPMSPEQVQRTKADEKSARDRHYAGPVKPLAVPPAAPEESGLWARLRRALRF